MYFIHLLSIAFTLTFFSPENLFIPKEVQSRIVESDVCDLTKSADEYVSLAGNYHDKTLYFLAIENLSCAIQVDPQRTQLYLFRGNELLMTGQFERAKDDVKKVLQAEPDNYIPHALMASIYFEQANYSDALHEISNTLKLNESEPVTYGIRGQIYIKLNSKDEAIEAFNQYVRLQKIPAYKAKGYAEIGFAYEHFGDSILAQVYLKKAVELFPDVGSFYVEVAQDYRARSNFKTALDNLNKAIRLTPDLITAYYQRAAVNSELKYMASALKDCNTMIQLQPQKPDGYICRGIINIQDRNYMQATEDFNHAIQLDKLSITAYSGRALAETNVGNNDIALADINFAIKTDPLVSFNYQIRAQVYANLNKVPEAIADYETYLHMQGGAEINPDIVDKIHQLKKKIANL